MAKMVKSYVITKDVVPTLRNRLGVNIDYDAAKEIDNLESKFIQEFWKFINTEDKHVVLEMEQISGGVKSLLNKEKKPLVCFDDVYFPWISNGLFSITRLTDPNNPNNYIFGPRIGFPSLEKQIENIQRVYGKSEIAIVDVGAFSADSLIEPLFDFQRKGLNPKTIYLGLIGNEALEKLKKHNLEVNVAYTYDFDDWIELRDFFGVDGRNVNQDKLDFKGIENFKEKRLFMPYKEDPEDWASIAKKKKEKFRDFCDVYFNGLKNILSRAGYVINLVEVSKKSFGIYYLDIAKISNEPKNKLNVRRPLND